MLREEKQSKPEKTERPQTDSLGFFERSLPNVNEIKSPYLYISY